VAAVVVSVDDTMYAPSPASQAVVVAAGSEAASAPVAYTVADGSLEVVVSGVPPGTDAAVTVSGPGGYSRQVTATDTLAGLLPGQYVVTAQPVSDGGEQYTPAPSSQTVSIGASGSATATVSYSSGGVGGLNLRVDGLYLVQSVQSYTRGVPLVGNRNALLRVFVTANQVNAAAPRVRVTFYTNGLPSSITDIAAPALTTPQSPDESSLNSSWNLVVSGPRIQPNTSILVQVDPDGAVAEGNETDNFFPQSGIPLALDVRTTSPFAVRLVPVKTKADNRQGNVTDGNKAQFLASTMRMYPLAAYDADVRAVYTTSTDLPLQSDNGNGAWGAILSEVSALRQAEGTSRYYYGVVNPSYGGGIAGLGQIQGRTAIGWDRQPSAASIAAHEWGHNWGRQHAPCGSPGGVDNQYPYANGEIGVFGYDFDAGVLKPSDSPDLMGYCANEWISDYTYNAVLGYRNGQPAMTSGLSQAAQPALLVWGRIESGRAVLEPAFRITTRPSLPSGGGPYRIEGRAGDGSAVFAFDFTPLDVPDDPRAAKPFAFAVPLRPDRAARIASLHLAGAGLRTALTQAAPDHATVEVSRGGAGRVALRWDAARTPMIMVRDPVSGEILSFARGGRADLETTRAELALSLSDRVRSRDLRVKVR
jgi:hypothetical protein